jgi:hypothetical protein
MTQVEFEPTITVFELTKTVYALDCEAILIDILVLMYEQENWAI